MIRRTVLASSLWILAAPVLATVEPPTPAERLHALFDREWETRMQELPLEATAAGVHDYDDRLDSMSPDDVARRDALWEELLGELATIDAAGLSPEDRISYRMFERLLRDRRDDVRLGGHLIPLTSDSGFHTELARLPALMTLRTVEDYEHYLARLGAIPRYVAEHVELMRAGLERGMTLPRVVLEGYEGSIAAHVVEDLTESVFWAPFESFPAGVPESERERLREAGRRAVLEGAVAGYRSFHDFMVREYVPATRETLGASALPDGAEYYRHLVRRFTTLELTPEEIHRTGLDEVARIRSEMDAIMRDLAFEGSFEEFLAFLRTDPRFYAGTPEELLKQAAWLAKSMDGKLPSLFGRLPRQPYGVEPVPDAIAPKYTAGRYVGAPLDSDRAGTYWVNTYALESRPLYALEALTLHEAVPGHHLQIALAQELEELPKFRRFDYISAFGEGWGLYSERLGLEAGFYTDPYADFGRLTYEMWRACRLVVDTGIHVFGWTRQQAIDYLAGNTALSLHEVTTEIDRYISWPGQALAYKLGELTIRRLRAEAEEALGAAFDLRSFHDAVLANGSVPLPVLETVIRDWVTAEREGTSP
jgi:uncharacterized protein (DUF885 family)